MYIVRYYVTGGKLLSKKIFSNLSEAIRFSVYKVGHGQVHSIDLIKDDE
jgi:hypothetical protein